MAAQVANFSMNVDDIFNPFYVAVATGAATCQNNTDPKGGTWTSRTMPVSSAWQSVDYGNGMIVAVSSTSGQVAATSIDGGTTWVQRTLPTSTTWYAVKYGSLADNDKWVAVSSAGNYAATSPDGCTWTAQSITGTAYAWKSMAYGNGVWVALANASESDTLRTAVSSDGVTWSNNNTTSITCPGTWSSIFFGNGRFIAVCSGSTKAAYSTNGINWTETGELPANTAWTSVTYGDNVWIAVTATSSDKAARSADNGNTWSEITFPAASTWRTVIFGKNIAGEGVFAGIGATTVGNYSIDGGVTWAVKTQATMTYTAACYAPIRWYSADTLTINNQATITVNTDQNRFWYTMSINNGVLDISNSSTSTPITFAMGRSSGSSVCGITPASGLGSINIEGDWMTLGTGDGTAGQIFTAPYTDYIPAVWVDVSGTVTQWLNVTGAYGDNNNVMHEGLEAVGSGKRGNFFVQGATTAPYGPININAITATFANQRATRYLVVDSTTGITAGAQILGAGLTANSIVNRVISSTELELNLPTAYIPRTDWAAVAYGYVGGATHTYVAISKNYSDTAAYSTNGGVTWTKTSMPFKAEWSAICFGSTSDRFVAVCKNSNLCASSEDGVTWTTQYLPSTQNWNAVATNGTSFVAVGATTADAATTAGAYSADGLTWVATTMSSAIWRCAAYGNSQYIAIAQTGIINYDADGAGTWTAGTSLTSATYVSVIWNGSRFVAISGSSTTTRYSTTGTGAWSSGGALPNSSFTSMCWTGSYFVATSTSTTAAQTAVTSTDGSSWTNRTLGVNQWSGICSGNSVTVAVAGASGTNFAGSTASTSDATGVTWTNQSGMVSDVDLTIFNPYRSQLTNQLTFGDGVHGNVVPNGAIVRCPNIMVTSLTPANLQTSSNLLGASFVLTNSGRVTIDTALFDEFYGNFIQAQSLSITDAAFSIPFLVQECYDTTITRVAFALQPVRRYFTLPYWYSRELRYGQTVGWNYINDAVVTDLLVAVGGTHAQYGSTTAISPITLSYIDNATFTRLKFYSLNPIKANQTGILVSAKVTNSIFNYCEFYGTNICTLTTSDNNTITNSIVAPRLYSGKMGLATSGTRIGVDPATGNALIDGTKYYFKVRSYRDWTDLTEYVEGPVVSATPFIGSKWFSPRFSAVNTASTTVTFNWDRRDPTSSSVAFEIFRGTSSGFTRNLAARIFNTATTTTITATDTTVANGNTYYYVLRKYDGHLAGITNSSGSAGQYVITTSQNFFTGLGTITLCSGTAGTKKVYLSSGVAANFLSGNVWVGMPISGGGLAADTTVTSIDNELEITVSNNIDTSFIGQTLYLGVVAGLYVNGTGITAGTKVASVDSSTQITVDTALSGTVSGTLTFLCGTESAEVEVYVAGAKQTASNYLFQSYDFTNASWVKTNLTPTAAVFFPPEQVGFNAASAPTALGVRLWSIGPNANMANTQTGLTSATAYCFSIYVMTPPSLQFNNVVSCTITIDTTSPTTANFNATGKWQRIEVPFTSTSTSHIFTFTINDNGAYVYASCAQVNLGSTATTPVTTTTAAVTLNPVVQEITAAYAWGRSTGGETSNQGIELVLASAPTGTHYSEVFMGTSADFVPSVDNVIDCTIAATWSLFSLTTCSSNNIETITQDEKGQTGTLVTLSASPNNTFKNINYDFDYGVSTLFNISNLSNNNLFHNFNIYKYRNYIAASAFTTVNNASGITIQNCYFDTFDLPILISSLDTILKGVSGGHGEPTGSATTWTMGGTLDTVGVANITVYDTNFHEMYHTSTTGALNLIFNDSSKTTKPYSVLAGNPSFSNTGKLFLQNANSIVTVSRARSNNVATVVTSNPHRILAGDNIVIAGLGGTGYNGTQIVTAVPTTTSFTFANTGSNEGVTADTAGTVTVGDSIVFTWPHAIKGVTGFRNLQPKFNGLDHGTAADRLFGLKIEFAIDDGYTGTYGNYSLLTGPNLAATTITSATTGFGLKIKITARPGMKYTSQTGQFVVDEQIKGVSSGATAYVREDNDLGTTGDLILDNIVGTFIAGEVIVRASDNAARATNLATNTNFALFPSFTSYIDGLQIYTNTDPAILYPASVVTVTLVNIVPGSMYYIYNSDTNALVASGTASGTPASGETTVDYAVNNVVYESDFDITINVRKSSSSIKYLPYETGSTVTSAGASVFIAQVIDTVVIDSYGAMTTDWTISTNLKTIKHTGGTTVYTVKEFYSWLLDYFDELGYLDDQIPISASTPTEYNLINGWFIDDESFKYLAGGSITTSGWTQPTNATGIRILTLTATEGLTADDIGKVVAGGTTGDTGKLLDYDTVGHKLWVRSDAANDLFDDSDETITVDNVTCGSMTAISATGENIWANIFTLGSLVSTTTLDVYQNDIQITPWWSTGHIDILVKVKEAGTEIDSGNITVLARKYGSLYDHFIIDASSGRNPVPLAAFTDGNNQTDASTVGAYTGISFTFGHITKDLNNGNGACHYDCVIEGGGHTITEIYEYLKYVTRTGSTTTLNGVNGEYYTGAGEVRLTYDAETNGPFTEGERINGSGTNYGYLASLDDQGSTGYMVLRNVHGTFTDEMSLSGASSEAIATVNGTVTTITQLKQAPFGTLAGGTFFGARGIWLENVAAADANNYQLVDSLGVTQIPPALISITVTGVVSGDIVSVFRTTGDNEIVNKSIYTSHSTSNASGSSSFVVNTAISNDTPTSGTIRVVNRDSSDHIIDEQSYSYTSWTGSTFSLTGTLSQTYDGHDTAYVPFIDQEATSTSVSTSITYVADRYVVIRVRKKGIVPFTVKGQITSSGLSVTAIRTTDTIVA